LVEVTNRTVDGRFLLRPSREVNDIILGVLARAARLYRVGVCAFNFLSNHYHLLLRPADAQALRGFMTHLNTNLSKEIGRHRGWRGLWRRRYHHAIVSDEPEAQLARLRYVLGQGCKEGLVRSPKDWPGASCVEAITTGRAVRGIWFNRTAEHKARKCRKPVAKYDYAEVETLGLVPLPCWEAMEPEQVRERCRSLVGEIEEETRSGIAESGKAPLGKRRILRQDLPRRHLGRTQGPRARLLRVLSRLPPGRRGAPRRATSDLPPRLLSACTPLHDPRRTLKGPSDSLTGPLERAGEPPRWRSSAPPRDSGTVLSMFPLADPFGSRPGRHPRYPARPERRNGTVLRACRTRSA
jgi:REP element-mobilizing transposase RayT